MKLTNAGFLAHLKTRGMEQIELMHTKLHEIRDWVSAFYAHEGRTPTGTEADDLVRDFARNLADRKLIRL